MGCDIHVMIEEKFEDEPKEGWQVSGFELDYFGRNYDVFGMLADVRNGIGFAGINLGDGFEPIDEPRGVPVDAGERWLSYVEEWDCDGHSHGYFYLKELKELLTNGYFDKETKHRGIVSLQEYREMETRGGGRPSSWSIDISGPGIRIVTPKELDTIDLDLGKIYVSVEWKETYRESGQYLIDFIEKLVEYEIESGACHNCVRMCFLFDN